MARTRRGVCSCLLGRWWDKLRARASRDGGEGAIGWRGRWGGRLEADRVHDDC